MNSKNEANSPYTNLIIEKYGLNDPQVFIRKTLGIQPSILSDQDIQEQLKDPESTVSRAMRNAEMTFIAIEYENLNRSKEISQAEYDKRILALMKYEEEKENEAEETKVKNGREIVDLEKVVEATDVTSEQKAEALNALLANNNVLLNQLAKRYFDLNKEMTTEIVNHISQHTDRIEERAVNHLDEMEQLYRDVYNSPQDAPRLQRALEFVAERREIHEAAKEQRAKAAEVIARSQALYAAQQAIITAPPPPPAPPKLPQGAERLGELTQKETKARGALMQDILSMKGKAPSQAAAISRVNAIRRESEPAVSPLFAPKMAAPSPVVSDQKDAQALRAEILRIKPDQMQVTRANLGACLAGIRAVGDAKGQEKLAKEESSKAKQVAPDASKKTEQEAEKSDRILNKLSGQQQADKAEDKQSDKELKEKVVTKVEQMDDVLGSFDALLNEQANLQTQLAQVSGPKPPSPGLSL